MSNLSFVITGDVNAGNTGDFALLPDGWYPAKVSNAEIKQTNAGTGSYVSVRFSITGDKFANRTVFANYNTDNPSEKAQEIGRAELSRLTGAVGVDRLTNTDQLIGRHCEIHVKTKKSEEWGDKNEVKGYRVGAVANAASTAAAIPSFGVSSAILDDDCPF